MVALVGRHPPRRVSRGRLAVVVAVGLMERLPVAAELVVVAVVVVVTDRIGPGTVASVVGVVEHTQSQRVPEDLVVEVVVCLIRHIHRVLAAQAQ